MKLDRKDKLETAVSGDVFDYVMTNYSKVIETAVTFVVRYSGKYYQIKPANRINPGSVNFTIVDGSNNKSKNTRGTNILLYLDSLK